MCISISVSKGGSSGFDTCISISVSKGGKSV